ncbi:hypothetical protein [Mucilaginibacter sp. 3215]|uniref:hypothetical protein n=1 Tax=Mucilaginibacter sp. 3215 TaxID=3373912 RepID=UPI003D24C361
MINQFNTYNNIRSPKVKEFTTIDEWFSLIKESEHSDKILKARPFGKKHEDYEEPKSKLPTITYNFLFHTNKEDKNILWATGLLYIDIDELDFDINTLDKSKVFAYYKSFGGNGYSVLVQVKDLTLNNYSETYISICNDLGITSIYDKNAAKATQFNVLSYDPDIFINYNSFVFDSVLQNVSPVFVIEEEKRAYTNTGDTFSNNQPIRFSNLYENLVFNNGDEYIEDWNGIEYVCCFIPMKKIKSNRNKSLLNYTNNLVWLNPQLTEAGAETILMKVNPKMCEVPVDNAQIKRIVKSVFKYKHDGTLKPTYFKKKRKIVFALHSELTRNQKLKVCRELLAVKYKSDSTNKLYQIIENWDFENWGKVTTRAIIKYGKMSNKTIVKYWPEFKEYVKELNEAFKAGCNMNDTNVAPVVNNVTETVKNTSEPNNSDIRIEDFGGLIVQIDGYQSYQKAISAFSDLEYLDVQIEILKLLAAEKIGNYDIEVAGMIFTFFVNYTINFVCFQGCSSMKNLNGSTCSISAIA